MHSQNAVYFNFVDLVWLFLRRKATIRNVPNDFERQRADQLMNTSGFNRVLTAEFLVIKMSADAHTEDTQVKDAL